METKTVGIWARVVEERARQDRKWGVQRLNSDRWNTILGEEAGEVAHAINEGDLANMEEELVQVAAVAVAWLYDLALTRKEYGELSETAIRTRSIR